MDPAQRQQMMERMQSMSPEERQQFFQRMRERGSGDSVASSQPANRMTPGQKPLVITSGQTIDSLFGPLPRRESAGRVWLYTNGQLKSVRVRLGISDGTSTELLSTDLPEGTELVTGILLAQTRPASTGGPSVGGNPFMGGPGPGGFRPPDRH
jgi:HlyD family secretion protein